MLEQLRIASQQLQAAIERYSKICSDIQSTFLAGPTLSNLHSDCAEQINRELEQSEYYDAKIQQAKKAIRITHNNMTPINRLPHEILTRIFETAHNIVPACADYLAAVCSRWCSILLSTSSLWTCIDYRPNSSNWRYAELLDRAFLHLSRSGQASLDIHISAASELYQVHHINGPVLRLCREIAPRTRSLELDFEGFSTIRSLEDTAHSVFSSILSGCVPGILTKLVIMEFEYFGFFATKQDVFEDYIWPLRLDIEPEELENIFHPITVVHLTGIFPQWTSRAYHGLVDLRLYAAPHRDYSDGENTIPESQLVNILKASPGLRILHFELEIAREAGNNIPFSRVSLSDLEVLQAYSSSEAHNRGEYFRIENLLRLIEPGRKPLHLFILHFTRYQDEEQPSIQETKAFLTRSNVTKLYLANPPRLYELLHTSQPLKVLVLNNCGWLDHTPFPQGQQTPGPDATYPQVDTYFVVDCSLSLDGFLTLVQKCRIRSLVIYSSEFYLNEPEDWANGEVYKNELSIVCQDVRFVDSFPDMAQHCGL